MVRGLGMARGEVEDGNRNQALGQAPKATAPASPANIHAAPPRPVSDDPPPIGLSPTELRAAPAWEPPWLDRGTKHTIFKSRELLSDEERLALRARYGDSLGRNPTPLDEASFETAAVWLEGLIVGSVLTFTDHIDSRLQSMYPASPPPFTIACEWGNDLSNVICPIDIESFDAAHVYYDEADGEIHADIVRAQGSSDREHRISRLVRDSLACPDLANVRLRGLWDEMDRARGSGGKTYRSQARQIFMEHTEPLGPIIAKHYGWPTK